MDVQSQVFSQWIGRLDTSWHSCENHVLELDGVVRQRIDKVEMEITQEVRIILQNEQHNPNSASVECFDSLCRLLIGQHIIL
jgi:hypothetical protein